MTRKRRNIRKRHQQHSKEFWDEVNSPNVILDPIPFNISDRILIYGKYKNQSIDSVPKSYLRWMLDNIKLSSYHRSILQEII